MTTQQSPDTNDAARDSKPVAQPWNVDDLMQLVFKYGAARCDVDRSNSARTQNECNIAIDAIMNYIRRLAAPPADTAMTADAARYRWLRSMAWGVPFTSGLTDIQFPTLPHRWIGHKKALSNIDTVIDERIAARSLVAAQEIQPVQRETLSDGFDGSSVRVGPNHSTIEIWYDTEAQAAAAHRVILDLLDAAAIQPVQILGDV